MEERLAIAGSGAIACGLAATAARHGEVVLLARAEQSASAARSNVERLCGKLSGEINASKVSVVTAPEALDDCSFVVEAVVEDMEIKGDLLARLGARCKDDAVLASTTSALSIAALADASGRPDRFVGLHVFNPVAQMKLIELVFPEQASAETRSRTLALCEALGKTGVEVPDTPGFVVNRLLFPFLFDAVELLESTGLEPEAVDSCMKLGAGHPMGPLALLDYVGLDVAAAIGEAIEHEIPERLQTLVAEGALGRKSGQGFYAYNDR